MYLFGSFVVCFGSTWVITSVWAFEGRVHFIKFKRPVWFMMFANYYRLFPIVSPVLLRFCYHRLYSSSLSSISRPVKGPARDRLRQKPHRCARARKAVDREPRAWAAPPAILHYWESSGAPPGSHLPAPRTHIQQKTDPNRPAKHRQVSMRPLWAPFRSVSRGGGFYLTGVWKQCAERERARAGGGVLPDTLNTR